MGFRVKSDLRNHQAIVQPRLYDSLMVTQITLNTEPHGFDSSQGRDTLTKKLPRRWSFVVPEALANLPAAPSSRCVRARLLLSRCARAQGSLLSSDWNA